VRAVALAGLDITVSVNISARNFADSELIPTIATALAHANVPADRLVLEITESQLMSDPVAALEAMERMTTLGVRTSVDDFGTGYSSMSHLRRLPINEIKIDQSFVLDMTRNESDRAIVRSIIELGHNLGLDVVAEGVEDKATLRALIELDRGRPVLALRRRRAGGSSLVGRRPQPGHRSDRVERSSLASPA
jgi:EAL domain-containing protein (putative c-di-GMP-specific phosphodiesterase class I)